MKEWICCILIFGVCWISPALEYQAIQNWQNWTNLPELWLAMGCLGLFKAIGVEKEPFPHEIVCWHLYLGIVNNFFLLFLFIFWVGFNHSSLFSDIPLCLDDFFWLNWCDLGVLNWWGYQIPRLQNPQSSMIEDM